MANTQGQFKKKLTVKDIMGSPVQDLQVVKDMLASGLQGKKPAPVVLCKIVGMVNKAKPGFVEKTSSEYVRFSGEFVGVNALTGERLVAGAAILPGAAESMIYGALGQLDDKGQGAGTVEFGIEVSVRYDDTAITKYAYDVRSLVEHKTSTPLNALLEKAGVLQIENKSGSEPAAAPAGKGSKKS